MVVVRGRPATSIGRWAVAKGCGATEIAATIVLTEQIGFLTKIGDTAGASCFASWHLLAASLFDELGSNLVEEPFHVVRFFCGRFQEVHTLLLGKVFAHGDWDLAVVTIGFVALSKPKQGRRLYS